MNGLAQYGVGRGSVLAPQKIVITGSPPDPDPVNLDKKTIQDKLITWIKDGSVSPAPSVGEQNLIYVIFLPTGSTYTDTGAGYHSHYNKYNASSSEDDLFWAVILTNYAPQTSATNFVAKLAYIVSHELSEGFTDRDEKGFTTTKKPFCEIGDLCESRDPVCSNCCTTFNYSVSGRTWQVEPYWSNWELDCINGNQPLSIRKFLQAIGVDGAGGLLALHSAVINIDFVASKM
jgi:hypothetical protein